MAKCIDCGKSGIFVGINGYGLCKSCFSAIRGLIKYHGLIPFWTSLNQSERHKCMENYDNTGITANNNVGLIKGNINFSSQSKSTLLGIIAANLLQAKEYELSEKVLSESERHINNAVELHFHYNDWIDLAYKQRENPYFLNLCIEYCKKDIEIFPKLRESWVEKEIKEIKEYQKRFKNYSFADDYEQRIRDAVKRGIDIRIPSFERLAIIYEKQAKFQEAAKICELAISYNLEDSKKNGFEDRFEKLNKKLK
jgi:hypothetical protein